MMQILGVHSFGCRCFECSSATWSNIFTFRGPEHDFFCDIEMPGVKRADISVKTRGDIIVVVWTTRMGERKTETYPIGRKYYDLDKLSVKYEDGLLRIRCPLKPEPPLEPPQEPEIDIEIK